MLLRNFLLLLGWADVVTISVCIVSVEKTFESLDQLSLLVLDLSLVGITWEVDVFSLFAFAIWPFALRGGVLLRVEGRLLVKFVES